MQKTGTAGALLRGWRQRRRLSQLELALEAGVSTRHLSFIETGRALPSRDMVLRLAEQLDVPLRERNELLLAAGFAPAYGSRSPDAALAPAMDLVNAVLRAHEPYPALAIDRYWTLISANRAVSPLLAGCAEALLIPPVNVLRLTLHPEGMAPRIDNLWQWRAHLLHRLGRQLAETGDARTADLLVELKAYPCPSPKITPRSDVDAVAVALRLWSEKGLLSLLGTTMVFGTPLDVTLSELAIETLLPADPETAERLRELVA